MKRRYYGENIINKSHAKLLFVLMALCTAGCESKYDCSLLFIS